MSGPLTLNELIPFEAKKASMWVVGAEQNQSTQKLSTNPQCIISTSQGQLIIL